MKFPGKVVARVGTLGWKDPSGRIIESVLPDQICLVSPLNHSLLRLTHSGHPVAIEDLLPHAAGVGEVFVQGDELIFRGYVDPSCAYGRAVHAFLHHLGAACQWSIAWQGDKTTEERDGREVSISSGAWVWEVCPVIEGDDKATRTLSLDGALLPLDPVLSGAGT